ncbi:MAG TPA: phospholipase A [Tepidisphaeraceae bacterium]|nr:phospholipase A [Tepidisphaeraceae bacterium]
MKKLVVLLMALLASVCFAGNVSTVLVPAQQKITAGSRARFWVVYLNTGAAPVTIELPTELSVTVESAGRVHREALIRQSVVSKHAIGPGDFYRAAYAMQIPADITGRFIVSLAEPGAAAIALTASQAPLHIASVHASSSTGPAARASVSTQPLAIKPESTNWFGNPGTESFLGHFSTYQPTYFIIGSKPTAKFQISLKYQILDNDGSIAQAVPALKGLNIAYTQTSFWDWTKPSAPFVDNSYRPELMFSYDHVLPGVADFLHTSELGLQGGWQHESNGRDGSASRSMNLLYIRPILVWDIDKADDLFISVAPRLFTYVTSLSDNPDMPVYRGYGDIRFVIGQRYGLQLAAFARVGDHWDKGSLELDLSQPLRGRSRGDLDLYLYAQFFTGYGEELLYYNRETTTFRAGVGFVR